MRRDHYIRRDGVMVCLFWNPSSGVAEEVFGQRTFRLRAALEFHRLNIIPKLVRYSQTGEIPKGRYFGEFVNNGKIVLGIALNRLDESPYYVTEVSASKIACQLCEQGVQYTIDLLDKSIAATPQQIYLDDPRDKYRIYQHIHPDTFNPEAVLNHLPVLNDF